MIVQLLYRNLGHDTEMLGRRVTLRKSRTTEEKTCCQPIEINGVCPRF